MKNFGVGIFQEAELLKDNNFSHRHIDKHTVYGSTAILVKQDLMQIFPVVALQGFSGQRHEPKL